MSTLEAQRNAAVLVRKMRAHVTSVTEELKAAIDCQQMLNMLSGQMTPDAEAAITAEVNGLGEILGNAFVRMVDMATAEPAPTPTTPTTLSKTQP